MARSSRRLHVASLLTLLLALPLLANAQLSSVPNLSTATNTNSATTTGQTTQQTSGGTTTGTSRTTRQTAAGTSLTNAPKINPSSSGNGLANPTNNLGTAPVTHLTGIPTLAGVGIPDLVIPYTANAPFMQKSSLPEGTFFIAVGATLAFLGACVLFWRLMVAWSINRSVRRTAMLAHMGGSEKASRNTSSYWGTGGGGSYNRMASSGGANGKGGYYKDPAYESTVSLDNLTSAGKPVKPHFRDSVAERNSTGPGSLPANLFFSPTAQAASQQQQPLNHRHSGYMPSGYYASPSAQVGGGNSTIGIGGNLAPGSYGNTNRYSAASAPSPPVSPSLPPQSRGSNRYSASRDSSAYMRASSRDGLRAPSRDGLSSTRNSALYAQPSSSSLMVGQSSSDLPGSRAPSAYLEELFDNHGSGPRERF